jgi:PAS domain S-box-containing protein
MHDSKGDSDLGHAFPDLNPNPVFESDVDGKVVYANPAARAIFGNFECQPWLRDTVAEYADGKRDNTTLTVKSDVSCWFLFTVFLVENPRLVRFYGMDITEQKRAEEQIQCEKDRFRSVLESSLDCIYRLNLKTGRYEYISPSCQKVVGFSPAELMAQGIETAMSMVQREDVPALRTALAQLEKNGEATGEYRQLTKTGEYRWISNHMSLVKDKPTEGHLYRDGIMRDITQRKEAEEDLKRSEVSLAQAQRIGQIGSWEWNIQTGELRWSAQLYTIYGVEPTTFTPTLQSFAGFVHPEDRETVQSKIDEIMSAGKSVSFDFRIVVEDGSTRFLNTVGEVIQFEENGKPLLMAGVNQDITERKKMEHQLKSLNESLENKVQNRTRLYRMLSDCNQALVTAIDELTLIQTICEIIVNSGGYLTSWVGYAERDQTKSVRPIASVGISLEHLTSLGIVWSDVERGQGPSGTAIRENQLVIWSDELGKQTPSIWQQDKALQRIRTSISVPLRETGKPPFGALTVATQQERAFNDDELNLFKELAGDLSFGIQALRAHAERDSALRNLEHINNQLHEMSAQLTLAEQRERRQLAGVLHDELQQLLVSAKIRMECIEDEALKACQDLLENSLRITRSLTAELCPPVLYKGNIIAVLEWLTDWANEKYGLNILLETALDHLNLTDDLTVMIYRSVQELLLNIAKHAKTQKGKIEVFSSDRQISITISDKGVGFDPSFVQEHSVEGGFGLFAVRERLLNRGCEFRIRSAPGEGSAFTIAVTPTVEPEFAVAEANSCNPKIRVLIADDHSVVRQALGVMLNMNEDIEVIGEAENGRIALDFARRLSPDIVLMDIEMPGLDGIKATRLLRLENPHIKVIGLSMHDEKDAKEEIMEAGASVFLMKNVPSTELLKAIRGLYAL